MLKRAKRLLLLFLEPSREFAQFLVKLPMCPFVDGIGKLVYNHLRIRRMASPIQPCSDRFDRLEGDKGNCMQLRERTVPLIALTAFLLCGLLTILLYVFFPSASSGNTGVNVR